MHGEIPHILGLHISISRAAIETTFPCWYRKFSLTPSSISFLRIGSDIYKETQVLLRLPFCIVCISKFIDIWTYNGYSYHINAKCIPLDWRHYELTINFDNMKADFFEFYGMTEVDVPAGKWPLWLQANRSFSIIADSWSKGWSCDTFAESVDLSGTLCPWHLNLRSP